MLESAADLQKEGTENAAGLDSALPGVASSPAPESSGAAHGAASNASSRRLQSFVAAAGLAEAAACFAAASGQHDVHSEADACAATQADAWTLSLLSLTEVCEVVEPADYLKVDAAETVDAADAAAAAVDDDGGEERLNAASRFPVARKTLLTA